MPSQPCRDVRNFSWRSRKPAVSCRRRMTDLFLDSPVYTSSKFYFVVDDPQELKHRSPGDATVKVGAGPRQVREDHIFLRAIFYPFHAHRHCQLEQRTGPGAIPSLLLLQNRERKCVVGAPRQVLA